MIRGPSFGQMTNSHCAIRPVSIRGSASNSLTITDAYPGTIGKNAAERNATDVEGSSKTFPKPVPISTHMMNTTETSSTEQYKWTVYPRADPRCLLQDSDQLLQPIPTWHAGRRPSARATKARRTKVSRAQQSPMGPKMTRAERRKAKQALAQEMAANSPIASYTWPGPETKGYRKILPKRSS